MSANDKLDGICRGIHRELYQLKEALVLSEFVGREARTLNAASFGQFFGTLQGILGRALLLHAARLFDKPKAYELLSLPAAIDLLQKQSSNLSVPGQRGMVAALTKAGVNLSDVDRLGHPELTTYVAAFFDRKLAAAHIDATLDVLKTVRDKLLAHPEAVDAALVPKPTYEELDRLVELTELFLDVVWVGYGNVYNDSGSDASRRTTISLNRLLERAGIKTTLPTPTAKNA